MSAVETLDVATRLYRRSGGRGWEPPNAKHPIITSLIGAGYLRPCRMRCGFEAWDGGVTWTESAHAALAQPLPPSSGAPNGQ